MISRRHFSTGCIALLACPVSARAETYPARPIRLLVPYAAGGGTDAIARLIAQRAGEKLGQTIVIENNGAAGGNVATLQAALAAPDGYTMLMANQGPMVVNPHIFKDVKVDPLTAFDPVILITSAPLVVVVANESRFKSFRQLVEFGSKNPGKLTYGSAGNGSASHMATVLLARMAKLDMVHVPYRGAAPALSDVLGQQTDFMITTLPSVLGLVESSRLKPLAVTSKTRSGKLPEVPTIAESGWPGYEAGAWYGFVVPKETPREIIAKLHDATLEAIKSTIVRDRLQNEGAEPIGSTPEEFGAMMRAESKRWAELVREAKISVE